LDVYALFDTSVSDDNEEYQVGRHVRERTEGLLTCRFEVQGAAKDTVQKCLE
jgi:hypothetical protein